MFSKKIGYELSCKLSAKETIYMKYQTLFSEKNKEKILDHCLQNFFIQLD